MLAYREFVAEVSNNASISSFSPGKNAEILAFFVLCACLGCIWLVFFFGRRLQLEKFLRYELVDAVAKRETERRVREFEERTYNAPIDSGNPPPSGKYSIMYFWEHKSEVLGWGSMEIESEEPMNGETVDQAKARFNEENVKKEFGLWALKEQKLYDAEKKKLAKESEIFADNRVPHSMDISLLGGGFSFLLEFSTVIVIIFALIMLGILGILEGREIATILAAIAGYVLGKASGDQETQPPSLKEQRKTEGVNG